MADVPRFRYTGQETWLKRAAGHVRNLFEPSFDDKPAEVQYIEATDRAIHARAFRRYLERVKLPGEDGLTEFQRLKCNVALYEELLEQARVELRAEAREYEDQARRIEEVRLKLLAIVDQEQKESAP